MKCLFMTTYVHFVDMWGGGKKQRLPNLICELPFFCNISCYYHYVFTAHDVYEHTGTITRVIKRTLIPSFVILRTKFHVARI